MPVHALCQGDLYSGCAQDQTIRELMELFSTAYLFLKAKILFMHLQGQYLLNKPPIFEFGLAWTMQNRKAACSDRYSLLFRTLRRALPSLFAHHDRTCAVNR